MRTKEQIDKDYSFNALQLGHKTRVLSQLEKEIGKHLEQLVNLNLEGVRVQETEQKAALAVVPADAEAAVVAPI